MRLLVSRQTVKRGLKNSSTAAVLLKSCASMSIASVHLLQVLFTEAHSVFLTSCPARKLFWCLA